MRLTYLAIDDVSLPFRKNVGLYLSTPSVRREPVLAPSPLGSGAPDDLAAHFYGTVLRDGGRYRMWYYACHWGRNPDWPAEMMRQIARQPPWMKGDTAIYQGPLCYAESDDGVCWAKPALNQVIFKGSRANNALALPHTVVSGATVVKDEEDADPARRYKMVYQYFPDQTEPRIEAHGKMPTIALAVSPDGLRWTPDGIPFVNQFTEHCSFLRHAGLFIIHYQVMGKWAGVLSEGGAPCGRMGVARVSPDFRHWPDLWCETFALPEPAAPAQRGPDYPYDQVHLGVGATSLGNVCVGVYGLWHNAHFSDAFHEITCDLGLVVSNDGLHFREPAKGRVFLHRDQSPVTPLPGKAYNTILCQGNGILNAGDETRIYHDRWRNVGNVPERMRDYRAEVALATLPLDRWGALGLNPEAGTGTVCSAPLHLPARGATISVNADDGDGMAVELLDPQFRPIPGFCEADAGRVAGAGGLSTPFHKSV
jgi:hypothetical protein